MIDRIIELLLFKSMYYLIPPLQTPLTIAQNSLPLPLICVGRLRELAISLEQSLAPHFYPVGVFVGGGVSVEVQQEVEKVVLEHNVARLYDLKFVGVTVGIRERAGPAGALEWVKDVLCKDFGVT